MRVVVSGATGLIGRALIHALLGRGDEVVALVRSQGSGARLPDTVETQLWAQPEVTEPPEAALSGAGAVVHLLGEPVAQRWTEAAKQRIRDSRVRSTRWLVAALGRLPENQRPKALISGSAVGYYGPRGDELVDETAGPGSDFLAELTAAWESEAEAARALGLRVVLLRTGVVLSDGGGALAQMLTPFRLGVGGPVAGGRQYMSWIHLEDEVEAILRCLEEPAYDGAVNLTAPNPVTNGEFSRALGRVLHRPAVVPVPGLALRLMYGEMASVLVTGQRAVPRRLLDAGFEFRHPELGPALRSLLSR